MRTRLSMLGLALALLGAAITGAAAVPGGSVSIPSPASLVVPVQAGPGGLINPIRDCQTIRQCRYTRGGSYRGCISTYTCKVCKLVEARCEIGGRTQNCREMQCSWGG